MENPNDFDIVLKKIRYKAKYKNLKLASGEKLEKVILAAGKGSNLRLGLDVNPSVLLFGAGNFLNDGKADIDIIAKAVFETPLKDVEYEYKKNT